MKRLTIGAAVACALFALAFFANLARADRVDAMSENVMVYCSNAADIFRQGVWARTVGIARRIEQTPAGLTLPHSEQDMPLESIYHDEWRSMTAQERDFFSLHLFTGYDEADRIIARFIAGASGLPGNEGFNLRAVISPDVGSRMSQAYLETCVREQTAKKTFRKTAADALARQPGRDPAQLILAASSERLPVGSVGMVCNHKRHMAAWVMEKVVAGMPREDFWTLHPLPEHWSPAMKEWAVAMVDEAYLWPRGAEDFSQYIWTSCMEGK